LPKSRDSKPKVLLEGLQRPVHSAFADFDGDGQEDILTCEFAKWTGALAWWKNLGDNQYDKKILRNKPGAIKAYPRDLNNDGRLDIIALMAQGDEGVFIYFNEGNGKFREEQVLSFHSSYGSSYFNLYDFNKDGFEDIIYTCGDNADYPPIKKFYHGIRIFLNDGKNQFKEKQFIPLNGAYGAIPDDYDQDGDIDIAAISFFPDFKNRPEEGFVYLENKGDDQFEAYTFEQVSAGRWIVMDSADMDEDGDVDLILGSLAFEVIPKMGLVEEWVKRGVPYVILENTTIDH
jgi:hypothetical protein